MLSIKLNKSVLSPHLRWNVDWDLRPGVAHWLQGPNGAGKTSFFEELKCQWPDTTSTFQLGFTDQEPFNPFQDLTVERVFDVLYEIAPERRLTSNWRNLSIWDDESRILFNRPVHLLSGGENQWIKILMMRSLKSDVWLLDEPFQFLDKKRRIMFEACLDTWLQEEKYLIFSHHGNSPLKKYQEWSLVETSEGLVVSSLEDQ